MINVQAKDVISVESVPEEECAFWVCLLTNHLLIEKMAFLNDKKASGQTLQPHLMAVTHRGSSTVCLWH